jgi:heme exporter protein B
LSPELSLLRDISAGVLWVAALLSSLLSLDALFRTDSDDGSLEQLVLSPAPLTIIVLGKTCAHWLVSGLPLVLIAPVVASAFSVPNEAMTAIMLSLLLGTPTLSLIGSVGAALTIGLQRGSVLLALLVLPLSIPVLIFGARATDLAIAGEAVRGPLLLLGALLAGAVSLTPLASAAAVRISLD